MKIEATKVYSFVFTEDRMNDQLSALYVCMCVGGGTKSLQSGPILCNPLDCSPPGPSVHGTLHARILEWFGISFSQGSELTFPSFLCIVGGWGVLYPLSHRGSPRYEDAHTQICSSIPNKYCKSERDNHSMMSLIGRIFSKAPDVFLMSSCV